MTKPVIDCCGQFAEQFLLNNSVFELFDFDNRVFSKIEISIIFYKINFFIFFINFIILIFFKKKGHWFGWSRSWSSGKDGLDLSGPVVILDRL